MLGAASGTSSFMRFNSWTVTPPCANLLQCSKQNPLHLIHRHFVIRPITQRRGARRLVRRHLLSNVPAVAVLQILRDPRRPECVIATSDGAEETSALQKRSIHVEFSADDLDALYEDLQSRGVIFHEPPHDEPWERFMTAFDPDGNAVEFAQGRRGHNATG